MSALTASRDTPRKLVPTSFLGATVKGGVTIYEGSLVVYGPGAVSGIYAQPGSTATGLFALGRACHTVVNTSGTDGLDVNGLPISVQIETGIYRWTNGDSIGNGDIGKPCYVTDDQTVTKGGAGTKSLAGMILYVDTNGVWVWTSPEALALVAAVAATAAAAVPLATVQYAHGLSLVAGTVACSTLNITASSVIVPLRENPDATAAHWGNLTITSPVVGAPGSFNIHSANASDTSVVGAVVIG